MRKYLSFKELLVMGGGLFSMHFGAGCLLYPVTWGADAGSAVYAAYLGVFLSGIFLPWLGYLALANGRGNFLDLIRRAAPRFGLGFVAVLILVLGPAFMLPRITAALWAGIVQLLGLRFESKLPELAFNVLMYVAAFGFVSSPGKVVQRVGRLLFPVLLCIVAAVIAQSIATPIAPRVAPVFAENPTVHGFLAAYAVGDLQCALTYGLVLVHGIENAGIEKPRVSRNLLRIGVVGLGLLGLAHFGHMIAGANTGGTIRLNLSATYVQMVVELWGGIGGSVFLVALATASLTATIGITSSTASLWEKILGGRLSYRTICLLTCVIACAVSLSGIDAIVNLISPVIDACYPATIALALYYSFARDPFARRGLFALACALIVSTVFGAAGSLHSWVRLLNLDLPAFERVYAALPLSQWTMSWVPFTAAAFAAGWIFGAGRNE